MNQSKIHSDIQQHGCHVVKILEESDLPGFAVTVGLHKSYRHPEILLIGLDLDLAHKLLNSLGAEVKRGKSFESGKYYPGIIKGYTVTFKSVAQKYFEEYLGTAISITKNACFPVMYLA